MPRRAAHVDRNHAELVGAFRALGYSAAMTSMLDDGFPNLVIVRNGESILCEVKDGTQPPSALRPTPAQATFHGEWKGVAEILTSSDDLLGLVRHHL